MTNNATDNPDYRQTHLERGGDYDTTLASDPFDAHLSVWQPVRIEALLRRIGPRIGRYLDFACGTGRITSCIAPHAGETVGVDISDSMIEVARRKLPQARFVVADLTTQPVDLGQFDLISSFRFFGNAEPQLRQAVLRQFNSRMPVGGHLLIDNHRNPDALMYRLARSRGAKIDMDLTPALLREQLERAGFEWVTSMPIAAWQFRHAVAASAGRRPRLEAWLERSMSSPLWTPIAPAAVILARKARSVAA